MTSQEKKQLQIAACKVRIGIIESTHAAKCGHPGGSLSAADLFTYLYNKELNVDPAITDDIGQLPQIILIRRITAVFIFNLQV